jgi:glycosyltransferase involved in cell wall biosynthesis
MARKLLFYTHALVGGGAERVFARLASGFAAKGDEVHFTVDFDASEARPLLSEAVSFRVLPNGHAAATRALARWIAYEKPDASLSAISVSNLKHTAAAVWAGRGRRAILTYHGYWESESERLSRLGYDLTPLSSRLTGATVAVSEGLRADLVARFRASPSRTLTIFNPAAPEPAPAPVSREDLASRPPTIVAIGRLAPDKDFSTLLRAFARLNSPGARLRILGEGPLRPALSEEASALGIADRLEMPGFVADIGAHLGRARCVAVSSRRESFSLACVEALAHGLPVAATDCGGPRELLPSEALGRIVPVGDAEALSRALQTLLEFPGDPAPRQRHAAAFSLESALDRYGALIDAVIRHGAPRG